MSKQLPLHNSHQPNSFCHNIIIMSCLYSMNIINLKFVVSGLISQIFRQYNYHIITHKLCAHGKPQPYKLLEEDLSLFQKSNLALPQTHCSVTMYKGVHIFTSGQTITATVKSKSHLQDNSGILYTNNSGVTSHGRLEKVLLIECTE